MLWKGPHTHTCPSCGALPGVRSAPRTGAGGSLLQKETSKPREAGGHSRQAFPRSPLYPTLPGAAIGHLILTTTLGGCSYGPHARGKDRVRVGACRGWGVTCAFQKPTRGLGVASEVLARPLAQVPLLRGPQRDPSVQDMVRPETVSRGRLTPPGEGTAPGLEQRHRQEFRVKDRHSRGWGL